SDAPNHRCGADLVGGLPASDRGVPLVTGVNDTPILRAQAIVGQFRARAAGAPCGRIEAGPPSTAATFAVCSRRLPANAVARAARARSTGRAAGAAAASFLNRGSAKARHAGSTPGMRGLCQPGKMGEGHGTLL